MIKFHICFSFFFLFIVEKCPVKRQIDLSEPTFSARDTIYQDIFRPWDGIWEGTFITYEDPEGQTRPLSPLMRPDTNLIKALPIQSVVKVRQQYQSVTPYFQKVNITDRYIDHSDTITVRSEGINKVEDGNLWCIVQKPEETVIHHGDTAAKSNTIIWQRAESDPLRKEYFEETIVGDIYYIAGYGYYGEDDSTLNPRTWFFAKYRAISDYFR
ncbi:MAG: hypothetical protein KDC80_05295 [Saprospiraceae bacterium]|nr:hypothetical protein [Saprospiraceae bacterium]